MSYPYANVVQLKKMLHNLDARLGKAVDHAAAKGFDPNVLLSARLAPDQYALVRQVQAACDSAKLAAARLSGREVPRHEDNEASVAELRARISSVTELLGTFTEADFAGVDQRIVTLPFAPGMVIDAPDYLVEMALPNCYFHLCMAYAILRHNGVDLGKRDLIGSLNLRPA